MAAPAALRSSGLYLVLYALFLVSPISFWAKRCSKDCARTAARCTATLSPFRLFCIFLLCFFCILVDQAEAALPLVAANANQGLYCLGHDTPYHIRLQIIGAFILGFGNYREIALLCGRTTTKTVGRIIRLFREIGAVISRKRGRREGDNGINFKLGRPEKRYLRHLVRLFPTLYLDEYQARLYRDLGVLADTSTICRALRKMSLYRKRVHRVAIKRFTAANILRTLRFLVFRRTLNVDDVVWVDETGVQDAEVRRHYARAHGSRPVSVAQQYIPRSSRVSCVGAMTVNGMLPCTLPFRGSMKGWFFEWWSLNMLIPCLRPGQTVVMDNASFHRKNILRVLFAIAGVHLLFTPAHSPEYNPIETVWGCMKAMLDRLGTFLGSSMNS
jgi:hypothetical protein